MEREEGCLPPSSQETDFKKPQTNILTEITNKKNTKNPDKGKVDDDVFNPPRMKLLHHTRPHIHLFVEPDLAWDSNSKVPSMSG